MHQPGIKMTDEMKYSQETGTVLENREVSPNHFLMEINAPFVSDTALPGQFIMLKVGPGISPLLRRPFGIYKTDSKKGSFNILYRVVGEGTKLMAEIATGVKLDILGPLGNSFIIEPDYERVLLVAGGVGVAPLFSLARSLVYEGVQVKALVGGKTTEELLSVKELKNIGVEVLSSTESGETGYKGYVTDLMEEVILNDNPVSCIYSCGPKAMLKKVAETALSHGLPCQLSLEAVMACGFGVCLGCVIEVCNGEGTSSHDYRRVCCDGPVFEAKEMFWG